MLGAGELMFFSSDVIGLEILFGLFGGFRPLFHAGELMLPVALECAGPFVKRPNGVGVSVVEHLAALPSHIHQADFKQDAEVLGDGRLREIEIQNDIVYGALLRYEKRKNVAAAGFGHGVEGVGGGGSARHDWIIFPYRNMSSGKLAKIAMS
jgi:hypothetical protein